MGWFYLVMILAAVLLLILSLSKVRLRLRYRRQGKDDEFALECYLWGGLLFYKLEIPVVKMEKTKPKPRQKPRPLPLFWPVPRPAFKIRSELEGRGGRPIAEDKKEVRVPAPARFLKVAINVLRQAKRYHTAIMYLLGRVHLRDFRWETEVGTGDPSLTGFSTGLAWGLKGSLLTFVYRLLAPGGNRPVVAVTPNFEKACLNTALDCIFEIRIGYAILTGFKAIILRSK